MHFRRKLLVLTALGSLPACGHTKSVATFPPHGPAWAPPAPLAETGAPAASGYDKPPSELLDVLHAPSPPSAYVSPVSDRLLLVSTEEYPSIARVSEPFLPLAGVRVEPRNHSRHDTSSGYGIRLCAREYVLVTVKTGVEQHVALPPHACPSAPSWAPDGRYFTFQNTTATSVELWIGDAATASVKQIPGVVLNPMFDDTVQWLGGKPTLLVKLAAEQGPPPPKPVVPTSPSIQETKGEKGESSTYEARDTLNTKHDEELFDYYGTSQLALVDVASGAVRRVAKPALYTELTVAPDAVHVLVETLKKPYSYVTTWERFAHDVTVLDLTSEASHTLASLPVADRVPVHGVPTGPRRFGWRATEPATLTFAEALDNGDWKVKVPARDKVLMQSAPFTDAPVEILRTEQRFSGIRWTEKKNLALVFEYDDNRHWQKAATFDVDSRSKPRVIWDLSSDEHYKNPGSPVLKRLPSGHWVARVDGDAMYLSGSGGSPTGDRPFLDRFDLTTLKAERLFRSDRGALESFVAFASPAPNETAFITWHQSPMDPPNAFMRTGLKPVAATEGEAAFESSKAPVTHLPDPTPVVRAIKKRLVKYKRKDGLDLSATIYTPPGYQEGTRVPTILYAYPLDYADAKQAGQVKGSEQTFTRLRQYRLLLLAGYAIIDNASFPIVGDPKKAYDTYLEQLTNDAASAVQKAIEVGIADPERIGVTGHSHGALMTVNLLTHSDLFRAGVATSGSYNKTLTPFGFQNERRSVWEAQGVYLKASPFFFADKLKRPILIMHGEEDANPGTTPLQAKKLYEAIRGNGGTARLVMLPHEPHWYAAMESNEQLAAEMVRWFDMHVKQAAPREAKRSGP